MSQALHTASTGINSGQAQINVIANNVANINTTAFKAANMTFETLYSRNLSYGSAATKDGGGTNPKQIGLGVKVGGITRNFVSGEFVSTGRDMDTMISGNGFYVVQDADGRQYFTRDGVFSCDSDGNIVTQNGMKLVATRTTYSNASSDKTVKIPKNLSAEVKGDENLNAKTISELNNASITSGTVIANVTGTKTNADGTISTLTKEVTLTIADGDPTIGKIIGDFNDAIATEFNATGYTSNGFSISDGCISYEAGSITFPDDPRTTSNFVGQTQLGSQSKSDPLSLTVSLNEMVNYNDRNGISLQSTSIDENGIVVATYNNGAILTQYVDNTDSIQWKFTTPEGIVITGNDVAEAGTTIQNSNFILELATMVNPEGLISINNNIWEWGPDVGEIYYGMAGEMSFGTIETGGYEGSNVDIAFELTNMISAQRMIQMNSRVFSTASSVMETLAYLGQ